ncbi:hypothetical protein BOTCAL_0048g00020 [Botryotinia calthae]|uniref:Uncharacterized protein n=1 Tax=Botryotinia calthae TaxID=38488 RepID=A0A4Y8DBI4_9HELO|nr:hypothetical protein BOTCAL_0048g00020 [Botryotinia calthae]
MASESPLLLGLNRDQWTLDLLRSTIQELVRENYDIELELDQPCDTRPVLMHRLDNLLRELTPETVNILSERLRQRNWGLGDVKDRGAAPPIAARAAPRRTAVRVARVQPQIRWNLRNRNPPLPAGTGALNNAMRNPRTQSELPTAAQAARTSQMVRAVSGTVSNNDELRRLIREFAEAEARRGIEAEQFRGRISELEAVNNRLTTESAEEETR